jgi:hypothetical protein
MTRRIQRLLSVSILPAVMLAMEPSAQAALLDPPGFLRIEMSIERSCAFTPRGPSSHADSMVVKSRVAEQAGDLNYWSFTGDLFGGIGRLFLHPGSVVVIPYLA